MHTGRRRARVQDGTPGLPGDRRLHRKVSANHHPSAPSAGASGGTIGALIRGRARVACAALTLAAACQAPDSAYAPSGTIGSVEFAPLRSVSCRAQGSDNWPTTWGDDGALYTAWGDGWGFEPRTEKKLSLGIARIAGGPMDYEATNIRAPTIERTGDGASGPKASGLLMVDGVLYMLVRNLDNARLAWSSDRGRTWEWGFSLRESFGYPAFLNFGRDYASARDTFVYVLSADGADPYRNHNDIVMARVPRDRITERKAYRYFVRLDEEGQPVWSPDPEQRGPIFSDTARISGTDMIYVPPLDRYLMTVNHDSEGAWGIYDAPEPWGPWTTTFQTNRWDVRSYSYVFPTKWIEDEGRTLHLVFSGYDEYDAFCIRRVELNLTPS